MKYTPNIIAALTEQIPGTCTGKEAAFLYHLCGLTHISGWFVELGSYLGRTGYALCQAAQELGREKRVMLIDDFSYHVKTSLELITQNLAHFDFYPLIIDDDSRVIPKQLNGEQVALLFIDSNHTAKHFDAEWAAWSKHLTPGAVIACHDYGSPRWPEMKGVIDKHLRELEHLGSERRLVAYRWPK
jgi:predicted O-methyltransferase YrrM